MPRSDTSVDTASSDDDEYRLAQKEWQESVEELQQLALVLLLPWLGKFLGRKTSHWRAFFPSSPVPCSPSPSVRPLPPSRARTVLLPRRQTARIASLSASVRNTVEVLLSSSIPFVF